MTGSRAPGRPGRAVDRLDALRSLMTGIVRNLDLDAVTLAICNAARELLDADAVGIMTVSDGMLGMQACVGHRNIAAARFHAEKGEGVAGIVLQSGRPHRVDDFEEDSTVPESIRNLAEREGVRCSQGAPLLEAGQVTGVLLAWSRSPGAFDDQDAEALEELANLAAIAVANAQMYERARSAVLDLAAANKQLQRQYDVLSQAREAQAELNEVMLRGGGLTAITNLLRRYTDGEVVAVDADLATLAVSDDSEHLVEVARAQVRQQRRLRGEAGQLSVDSLVLTREISAGEDLLAYLWLSLPQQPDSLVRLIIDQTAVVCALELTKQRAILDARIRLRGDFLWDLLEGKVRDGAEASVRARYFGFSLPRRLRVMVLSSTTDRKRFEDAGTKDADALDRRWSALLARIEQAALEVIGVRLLAARRAGEFVLILPVDDPHCEAKEVGGALYRVAAHLEPESQFRVGVSAPHDIADDLTRALAQARTAQSSAVASDAPVAVFEELGILRFLLAPTGGNDLADYVRRVLGPVIDYDRQHSTELLKTVAAHLHEDGNLGRTAARLYVHPKTVRYRLDRVAELINRNFNSQQDCFDVQLALHIIDALGIEPGGSHCAVNAAIDGGG